MYGRRAPCVARIGRSPGSCCPTVAGASNAGHEHRGRAAGVLSRTLSRTLKPAGTHRNWPESTVTTVLSRTPPEGRRESGMRYQVSSSSILSTNSGFFPAVPSVVPPNHCAGGRTAPWLGPPGGLSGGVNWKRLRTPAVQPTRAPGRLHPTEASLRFRVRTPHLTDAIGQTSTDRSPAPGWLARVASHDDRRSGRCHDGCDADDGSDRRRS